MLEKRFLVKYLSTFDQFTAKSSWQCAFKLERLTLSRQEDCLIRIRGTEGQVSGLIFALIKSQTETVQTFTLSKSLVSFNSKNLRRDTTEGRGRFSLRDLDTTNGRRTRASGGKFVSTNQNRPFPSCFEPHYESEAKYKAFRMRISFVCIWMKTNFYVKMFALSHAFLRRFKATRKWPITTQIWVR